MRKIITLLTFVFYVGVKAQIITTVTGNRAVGFSGNGGQAISSRFYFPTDVAIDQTGSIVDVLGNTLISIKETNINVSSLPAGVYFVRVGTAIQKFVKE